MSERLPKFVKFRGDFYLYHHRYLDNLAHNIKKNIVSLLVDRCNGVGFLFYDGSTFLQPNLSTPFRSYEIRFAIYPNMG